ncbi:MAG: PAS domain-containing protein [Candidatus Eisenbacteria bacterium]|nr:PAS domain-containing protein [Candidatus Eisenbacteria bacterium]
MNDAGPPASPVHEPGAGLGPLQAILPRLIEALSDAVVVLDRRGRVVAANDRFKDAFGKAGDTVPGRPCPRSGECDGSPEGGACIACDLAESRAPRRLMQVLPDASGVQRRWEATLSHAR